MKRDPDSLPTSPHVSALLARAKRLTRERRYRERHRKFFIEGVRNFVAAVEHRFEFETVLHSDILLTSSISRRLLQQLRCDGVPTVNLSPREFRSISAAERVSGIAAIVRQRVRKTTDVDPRLGNCWIVLSDIRSPGNLGTLLRTSAAAGGAGLVLLGKHIDPFDPAIVRASMGALFRQTIVRTSIEELSAWVRFHNLQVVGASPDGPVAYCDLRFRPPTLIVLGEERSGLSVDQRQLCEQLVHIPMTGGIDSLNVSVAGSLLVYEAFRCTMNAPR